MPLTCRPTILGEDMLATENHTRSLKRILAIVLPVLGRQIRTIRVIGAILVALLGLVVSGFSQTTVSTGGIYPDKNALLQAMTESRFRDLIERRAITFTDCNGALRAIALGVCDYLAETTGCPSQLARMSLEGSIIPLVEDMFRDGLAHHEMAPGADAALLATTAAWAVFGAARRWFQTSNRISAEEMAARIETMVSPVLFGASQ